MIVPWSYRTNAREPEHKPTPWGRLVRWWRGIDRCPAVLNAVRCACEAAQAYALNGHKEMRIDLPFSQYTSKDLLDAWASRMKALKYKLFYYKGETYKGKDDPTDCDKVEVSWNDKYSLFRAAPGGPPILLT